MSVKSMTMQNMLDTVWDQVQKLQTGDTSAKTANAISGGVSTIIRGAALSLKYAQMTGRAPSLKLLDGTVLKKAEKA